VSTFCRRYCERYGVKNKLSSSHHPETNGQTEIANKMVKNFLRSFVNYAPDDWVDWVPDANPPWQPWSDFKSAADKVIQYYLNHPERPQIPHYFAARETSPR
jgi:hypothetical protein